MCPFCGKEVPFDSWGEAMNMAVSVNICQYHSQSSDPSSILTVGSRNIMYSFCRVAVSPYLTPSLLGIL